MEPRASQPLEVPSAAVRVAECSDSLEIIFEHCGLPHLHTLQHVCRLWHGLARAMPARWATASNARHLGASPVESDRMEAYFADSLPGDRRLAVADSDYQLFDISDGEALPRVDRIIGHLARLRQPMGIVADGTHVFVADHRADRLQQIRISDGALVDSTVNRGSGDGQLFGPSGLALVRGCGHDVTSSALSNYSTAAAGIGDRLYVADAGNYRVCVFGVSPLRFLTFFGKGGSAPLEFLNPMGLAVHAGCLYVADMNNKRV